MSSIDRSPALEARSLLRAAALRSAALLPVLLLGACGGGGSGSGNAPGSISAPLGTWNFFREGVSCEGDEFSALPMRVMNGAGDTYLVEIGDPGEAFAFTGVLVGGLFEVSGSDTVDGTTIEITSATWGVGAGGNMLQGGMSVVRTEGGVPCQVDDFVTAYREDGTSASVVAGPWEWLAEVVSQSGSCNQVGSTEFLPVVLHPRRAGQFTLEITTENGESLQFDAAFDGSELTASGSDIDSSGQLATIGTGSRIAIDPAGGTGAGTLVVQLDGGCAFTFDVEAIRPSVGRALLPYIEDVEGTRTIVGVDPADPMSPVVIVPTVADPEYGFATSPFEIDTFTHRAARRAYDADSRQVLGESTELLFYRDGNRILQVDLAVRVDALGQTVPPTPRTIHTGASSSIYDLFGLDDLSGSTTILTFSQDGTRMLLEVDRAGGVRSAPVATQGFVVGLTYDDQGNYDRCVVYDAGSDELMLQSVESGTELVGDGVDSFTMGVDGSVYFTRPNRVDVRNGRTGEVRQVYSAFGNTYRLGYAQGDDLVFTLETDSGSFRMLRTTPDGNAAQMAGTGDIAPSGSSTTRPVVVGSRALVQVVNAAGQDALFAAPMSGGVFTTLLSGPAAVEFVPGVNSHVLGERAYFDTINGANFDLAALDPLASPPVQETLAGHRYEAMIQSRAYTLAEGTVPEAMIVRQSSGPLRNTLKLIDLATNPMGLLSSAEVLFAPATDGRPTHLALTGRHGIVSDLSPGTSTDPASELYLVDLEGAASPLSLSTAPATVSIPIP